MAQSREINPVLAGVIIAVVIAAVAAFLWFRTSRPAVHNLPNQPPPGFGGVPAPPR